MSSNISEWYPRGSTKSGHVVEPWASRNVRRSYASVRIYAVGDPALIAAGQNEDDARGDMAILIAERRDEREPGTKSHAEWCEIANAHWLAGYDSGLRRRL